jgi:DNA-directed RNA polymerase subunit M
MRFCPRCGAVLIQKTKNFGCPRCSYSTKEKVDLKIKEKINARQEISVIKDKDVDTMPSVEMNCRECGHNEAHFWTSQTRGADETETKFYRCKKCKHTWRDYR